MSSPKEVFGVETLSNPNLLACEVWYEKGNGIEVKSIIEVSSNKNFKICHKKMCQGKTIFEFDFDVPLHGKFGNFPAFQMFDEIKLGEVKDE